MNHTMSMQESVHGHQKIPGGNLKENFQWAPDEYLRFLAQTEAGSVYRVRAIHVNAGDFERIQRTNCVEFTEDELKLAARSLGYRPVDLNHEMPFLEFPQNRVIDAEYEEARVEALIAVREPGVMSMIESKKIVAVSIEAQFRWADVVCDDEACWLRPVGIIFTGLGLLTPGVLPGDPLASIVMKKTGQPAAGSNPASSVTGTTQKVDTTPTGGGVILETKQAAPPPEQPKEEPEATTPAATAPAAPTETKTTRPPAEPTKEENSPCSDATVVIHAIDEASSVIKGVREEVTKLRAELAEVSSQVKLLKAQRRKGSRDPGRRGSPPDELQHSA
jgi:hypothetical protein